MSLSSAISAAMSGLSANSRRAELISSNIANATTPGYMRREIVVASNLHGAGASVTGIARDLQPALLADQRLAAAASAGSGRVLDFLEATEATLGTADGRFGLAQAVSAFDAALIQAAGQPHSETLLARAIQTATDLATRIRAAATVPQPKMNGKRLSAIYPP